MHVYAILCSIILLFLCMRYVLFLFLYYMFILQELGDDLDSNIIIGAAIIRKYQKYIHPNNSTFVLIIKLNAVELSCMGLTLNLANDKTTNNVYA